MYNQKHRISVESLLTEKLHVGKARLDHAKRLQTNEQIRILMDNVLLAINMNASMLSVQTIHGHIGLFVSLPDSWRSKNYSFEFVAAIHEVVADENLQNYVNPYSIHSLLIKALILQYIKC